MSVLNKRIVASLIKAGVFDQMGHPRQGLILAFERLLDLTLERRRNEDRGQFSLFGGGDDTAAEFEPVDIPDLEWDKKKKALLREGDARALRLRPPAAGPRWTDAPSYHLPDFGAGGPAGRFEGRHLRDRGSHHPAVHPVGRPDGVLPARGPGGIGRGLDLPQDGRPFGGSDRGGRHPAGGRKGSATPATR